MIVWGLNDMSDNEKWPAAIAVLYVLYRFVRRDSDGIAKKQRRLEAQAERRWLHGIADQIETSATLDEAKQHAKMLKEEAWKVTQ